MGCPEEQAGIRAPGGFHPAQQSLCFSGGFSWWRSAYRYPESVARIMDRMVQAGYSLQSPPKTGKELIETIMARKAISEFRWTSIEEIIKRGGALALLSEEEYRQWFDLLSPSSGIR